MCTMKLRFLLIIQTATDISVWHQCQHMRGCEECNEKGINSHVCPGLQRRCFTLREPKRGMKGAGQMDPAMDLSYRVCVIN